jgi:fatty-acyl-CoA synthase
VALPTVAELLTPLVDVDDRGVHFEDSFTSWRDHIKHGAAVAAALRARLAPDKPPHVGVLLQNTPFFSAVLVAAGLTGIVPVGLNPVRRGAALARDVTHADCQVVLADSASATSLPRSGPPRWRRTRTLRWSCGTPIPVTCSC